MNALFWLADEDITEAVKYDATRINHDTSRRVTTAQISVFGRAGEAARYDEAFYDQDFYAVEVRELYPLMILDGRDGVTKLFDGLIFTLALKHTDGEEIQVIYECDLSDAAAWLDRSVCWDNTFTVPMPCSDQTLITSLITRFCPHVTPSHVGQLVPSIQKYEWKGKTCRQVLDDISSLSNGVWRTDFEAQLWYGAATAAPPAPYALSTSPDYTTSFPVKVEGWKRDFTNPVNRVLVRGALLESGALVEAWAFDPVSIDEYGEYSTSIVDEQLTDQADAQLRAQTTVMKYSYPLQQGSFTVWTDDLECGQRVNITEDTLGIAGDFTITQLSMSWVDKWNVQYDASFGASKPDLEAFLRQLDQRTKWKTARPGASVPIDGSVTDDSISDDGLHAESITSVDGGVIAIGSISADKVSSINGDSILIGTINSTKINSINADTITIGKLQAGQIESVNGGSIVSGSIDYSRIGSINADTITIGKIAHTQIGSIDAQSITVGVILSDQLGDRIIDDLAKFADNTRPVSIFDAVPALPHKDLPSGAYFYYTPDGHFYRMTSTTTYVDAGTNPDQLAGLLKLYHVGKLSAQNITGAILAGQIDTINASDIRGEISAANITNINASAITSGSISADRIDNVRAQAITSGSIDANRITSINATAINIGKLQGSQIEKIDASTITIGVMQGTRVENLRGETININSVGDAQIGSVSGSKLNVGTVNSDKLNSVEIRVGGGGSKPGKFTVCDASGNDIGQIGLLSDGNYGGWFKVIGAGGTNYSSAKVYTNTAGNLFIRDADLSITNAATATSITTTPGTYDATYSSIILRISGATDKAEYMTRGVVLYYGSTKIASFNRAPAAGYGECVLYNGSGTQTILCNGSTGVVRADGGFNVLGNAVINNLGQYVGAIASSGSISAAGFSTIGNVSAANVYASTIYYCQGYDGKTQQVNVSNPAGGWYELYFRGGILVLVNSRS